MSFAERKKNNNWGISLNSGEGGFIARPLE